MFPCVAPRKNEAINVITLKERSFNTGSKEFLQSYKNQNQNSKFAQHLQEYSFGPMQDVMEILQVVRKGKFMNDLEKFYRKPFK
jgi:hypothetical protein